MNDQKTTVGELKRLVLEFSQARDWEQFHHPKDLGLALAIETGEVLEHFRFKTDDEIQAKLEQPCHRTELAHELADVLWALLRLADVTHIDLAKALDEKLALAAQKYPIEQSRGRSDKYTEYKRLESVHETPSTEKS